MRIFSKFKDYYDGALAFGHDESVVYERTRTGYNHEDTTAPAPLVAFDKALKARLKEGSDWRQNETFEYLTLGFCGKVYCLAVPDSHQGSAFYNDKTVDFTQYYGDLDTLKRLFPQVEEANKRIRYEYSQYKYPRHLGVVEEQDNIFLTLGVPVFAVFPHHYGGEMYVLNPCLKDVGFFRIVEPYQAFQQLEQYLSNVLLRPDVAPAPVDDKTKIRSHGFDAEYGFRTRKP